MTTTFTTLHGKQKEVETGRIINRPTAYGIINRDDSVLLLKVRSTGKWFLPGGGVEMGEKLEDGLRREVREETGLDITVGEKLMSKEHFFYYDPLDEAYHMFITFFRCSVEGGTVKDSGSEREETNQPQWVKIKDLQNKDFDDILHDVVNLMRASV